MKVVLETRLAHLNLISTFVLLSLCRYLCWWTISPRWYHPPDSQCFGIDMVCCMYLLLKFTVPK